MHGYVLLYSKENGESFQCLLWISQLQFFFSLILFFLLLTSNSNATFYNFNIIQLLLITSDKFSVGKTLVTRKAPSEIK